MIVETLFWFHPLVWWIGARLVEERERACDEEVLRLGNHPDVYADAILNVCKLYVSTPLPCFSGVSGASIKRRIEAIMANRRLQQLNHAKKFLLASAGAVALAGPVAIGLVIGVSNAPAIRAQSPVVPSVALTAVAEPTQIAQVQAPSPKPATPQPPAAARPKFDVVSVRRCMPGDEANGPPGGRGGGGGGRGPRYSPGRARMQCLSVDDMIRIAYLGIFGNGLLNYNAPPGDSKWLRNAPAWLHSDWYTVDAETDDPVANGPTGPGQRDAETVMEQMLQLVLEDRFQLKIHRDTEDVPMYNLTVAKGGLKIKPMEPGGCTEHDPTKGLMTGEMFPPGKTPLCVNWTHMNGPDWAIDSAGQTLERIAGALSNTLNRHVFDKTGVTDKFILHLQFAHDETTPGNFPPDMVERMFPPSDVPSGPSIFTVLEGLGLKLEPTKGPQGIMVIDHAERPSEN
jgi:bla regulator protein BlaR1